MSIFKNLFGKKESTNSCCNIQYIEVKDDEKKEEPKVENTNGSSCCKS